MPDSREQKLASAAPSAASPGPSLLGVLQADVAFLKSYLGLPNRVRQIAAAHWLKVLRESEDAFERKTAMLKIFEELLASTEDLGFFYFALKRLGKYPVGVLQHCLKFELRPADEKEWDRDMADIPEGGHFLDHLPTVSFADFDRVPLPGLKREALDGVLRKVTVSLRASIASRRGADRLTVKAYNKLKHGMMVRDDGDELIITIPNRGETILTLDVAHAEALVGTIVAIHQAIAIIVTFMIAAIGFGMVDRGYTLTPAEAQTLAGSFADIPWPF
jgi:hypothetical protein